jgi:hypothetical protein
MVPVLRKEQLSGGDEGARTPDLDSAIVALSQLSYVPWCVDNNILWRSCKGVILNCVVISPIVFLAVVVFDQWVAVSVTHSPDIGG